VRGASGRGAHPGGNETARSINYGAGFAFQMERESGEP
jgi:hypothetical protein